MRVKSFSSQRFHGNKGDAPDAAAFLSTLMLLRCNTRLKLTSHGADLAARFTCRASLGPGATRGLVWVVTWTCTGPGEEPEPEIRREEEFLKVTHLNISHVHGKVGTSALKW